MRAIWFNLPQWDEHSTNPLESGKVEWRAGFKSKLDNQLYKLHSGILSPQLQRNPAYQVIYLYYNNIISILYICYN